MNRNIDTLIQLVLLISGRVRDPLVNRAVNSINHTVDIEVDRPNTKF